MAAAEGAGLAIPSWVRINPQQPHNQADLDDNAARVRAADKAGKTYSLMLYGYALPALKPAQGRRRLRSPLQSPTHPIPPTSST